MKVPKKITPEALDSLLSLRLYNYIKSYIEVNLGASGVIL